MGFICIIASHLDRQPERGEGDDHHDDEAGDPLATALRLLGHADAGSLAPEPHDHAHVETADDHQGQQVGADEEGDLVGARTKEVVRREGAHAVGDVLLCIVVHLRISMRMWLWEL